MRVFNNLIILLKNKVWIILCILLIGFALYAFRNIYSNQYDNTYIQDLYDHSQWTMPINIRSIGDEKLYQFAGYIAVTTGKLFTINPESPPLAKYLYGVSIVLTNNAYLFTLPLFIITAFLVYLLALEITRNRKQSALTCLLFCSSPLAIAQIKFTMLDLPQLLTLLAHTYMMIRYGKTKRFQFALLSGIFFGAFMGIKIGFFGGAILLADIIYLNKKKALLHIIPLILISSITYAAIFLPYIIHEGILQWFRAEKWVLSFYLSSKAHAFPGLVFFSLFIGITKGWNANDTWRFIEYWTIVWPIMGVVFIQKIWKVFIYKSTVTHEYLYALYITALLLLSFLVVPFFPRYLLLILPFILMFVSSIIMQFSMPLKMLLATMILTHYILFLFPQPSVTIANVEKLWESGAYQDMYASLDKNTQRSINRVQFWRTGKNLEYDLQLISKDVVIGSLPFVLPWENKVSTGVSVHYVSPIGPITYNAPLTLLREQNVWKIQWDINFLFPRFKSYQSIRYVPLFSTFSRIYFQNTLISEREIVPIIYVTPNKIHNETLLQSQLLSLTGLKKHDVEYIYKANNLPEKSVKIGPISDKRYINKSLKILDPGITIKKQEQRIFYPERVSIQTYKQALKLIRSKQISLYPVNGGYIELKHKSGAMQKILFREPTAGHDIIL
ncbi:hypothetical protein COU88_03835 [Candidatus Roizmanbacteria bacterium CG10_big_fil_rev_8_21_14_0_10_39_6]|uniref:Uncharacterized protein n=1 Tax=Candidatus Roizmanbacteria bacterium CG10_big_fil_rev_8_21_14_0_10_39_6 TaxID=1974853 RepID=A0A2M8KRW9_9BACT|nr:MAG: hypothetical protein COU88_03835 [Candidatus Roizmanbacteria bacterium CG10_big_fil_rev_8_21_14_0_10_39_6]